MQISPFLPARSKFKENGTKSRDRKKKPKRAKRVLNTVGRRSELWGGALPFQPKKWNPPLPFQKFSYKVEKQPNSAKNCENGEKVLKVPKVSSKWP
jgi:hypothetical protein